MKNAVLLKWFELGIMTVLSFAISGALTSVHVIGAGLAIVVFIGIGANCYSRTTLGSTGAFLATGAVVGCAIFLLAAMFIPGFLEWYLNLMLEIAIYQQPRFNIRLP